MNSMNCIRRRGGVVPQATHSVLFSANGEPPRTTAPSAQRLDARLSRNPRRNNAQRSGTDGAVRGSERRRPRATAAAACRPCTAGPTARGHVPPE